MGEDQAAGQNEPDLQESIEEPGASTDSKAETKSVNPEASDLEKLIAERDHYLEMARRSRADFENYQKRISRELQTERKYALQPLLGDLLPVLDNLDRALEAAGGDFDGPARGLLEGIRMVRKQWLDALERHGVQAIQPEGQPFDYNCHEAVMQQPSDQPAMTVLKTLQTGYRLHDRVVRPAQVIVSLGPAEESGSEKEPASPDAPENQEK